LGFSGFFRLKHEQSAKQLKRICADDGKKAILDIIF
jgi:hypothetical protein